MNNIRKKLIEVLDKFFYSTGDEPYDSPFSIYFTDGECEIIADHLLANGVTVQEWIPVSEPPKQDGRYQVYKSSHVAGYDQDILSFAKDGREIDSYDFKDNCENVWYYYDSEWGYVTIDNVTHWMPLPEPPKGE